MLFKGITLNPPIFPSPINSIHLGSNMIWGSLRFGFLSGSSSCLDWPVHSLLF